MTSGDAGPQFTYKWKNHSSQNVEDSSFNGLCWSCHNDIAAIRIKTHSSRSTSEQYGDADGDGTPGWSIECRVCHDPHSQPQFSAYPLESRRYEGIVSSITATTLTRENAGWSSDQFKGFVVIPNLVQNTEVHKIIRNTSDTLTVSPPINLSKASPGDTFVIIYGKLVRSVISTPNSGDKTVKFLNDTGMNSFAILNILLFTDMFFSRHAAGSINGAVLNVNGGMWMD